MRGYYFLEVPILHKPIHASCFIFFFCRDPLVLLEILVHVAPLVVLDPRELRDEGDLRDRLEPLEILDPTAALDSQVQTEVQEL